jgi:hypothetical protein
MIERFTRDDFDNAPQHIDRHSVVESVAGLVYERQLRQAVDVVRQLSVIWCASFYDPCFPVGVWNWSLVEGRISETRRVRQKIVDRYGPACGNERDALARRAILDGNNHISERRKKLRQGITQADLAVVDERQHARARYRFRHGGYPKHRVGTHRNSERRILVAGRVNGHKFSVPHDQDDYTGKLGVFDGGT